MTEIEAWNDWVESDEGKSCVNAQTLKIPAFAEFLQNRIWRAFMAGVSAGKQLERQRIIEKLSKAVNE